MTGKSQQKIYTDSFCTDNSRQNNFKIILLFFSLLKLLLFSTTTIPRVRDRTRCGSGGPMQCGGEIPIHVSDEHHSAQHQEQGVLEGVRDVQDQEGIRLLIRWFFEVLWILVRILIDKQCAYKALI